MKTLTEAEFKKKYGKEATKQFTPTQTEDSGGGYLSQVGEAAQAGASKFAEGVNEAKPVGGGGPAGLVTGVGKIVGGAAEAVTSPVAPAINATLGRAVNAVGNFVSDPTLGGLNNNPTAQAHKAAFERFANSPAGEKTAGAAETVGNYAETAGLVAGGPEGIVKGKSAVSKLKARAPKVKVPETEPPGASPSGVGTYVKSTVRDIVPTKQRSINHQIAEALDFTPGDLNKISRSTGNDVGTWMSDNNLIGVNKPETLSKVTKFTDKNYDEVRSEVGKVKKVYKQYNVPRYVDALKQIQKKIKDVPGLEKTETEVDNLLNKKDLSLADVQRAKELMDEHFNLYRVTGDVGEGVAKEGLANVRSDLKSFIEKQVEKETGADIAQMNKNVATGKGVSEAMITREQSGLTRSNFGRGDIALAFFGLSNPVIGVPLFLIKKAFETPTVRLRLARFLDGLGDKEKARIKAQLASGSMPEELQQVIDTSPQGISQSPQ